MEKEIKKILYKVLPFVLCIGIVSGAVAPAYAAPTTIDQWAQYDGSGWSYNSSSGTFSWNTNMANSSEFVILSYLRDLYSSVKTYNDNLKSGWLFTSNGYSYPSGWSGSFYRVVLDIINNVNTSINNNFYSNLQSYSCYPLYTYKAFTDSNLYSQQSFSSGNFILNFFSGIASLNNNVAYIANQLYADNASGSYNARSLLNQALHKYVDNTEVDYTTILNSIKSNTDNLLGIKTDTANLSGIKTNTDNLSGIKTDTANLSDIKTDTSNLYTNSNGILSRLGNFTSQSVIIPRRYNLFNQNTHTTVSQSGLYYPVYAFTDDDDSTYFRYVNWGTNQPNIIDMIYNLSLIGNFISTRLSTTLTTYTGYQYNKNTNSIDNTSYWAGSIQDSIHFMYRDLLLPLSRLQYFFADDNTINAKNANASQEQVVLNNFTGSGAASASVSDFGAVKDSIVDFKTGFYGGASSSDTFSFLSGDSNAWDWFSQDTANDVDRTQRSNTRLLRSSSDVASDTPLLDSYYNSILSILGGDE